MIQKIMDLRNESSLFRKAPDAYGKMIQKQMDKEGMGTVYIDAQAAAEDSTTHEALNEIVEKGIVSAKELDESIKTGKPLTIESGKYMQLASEETPKILSNYTTMDKGERTIHDLNEIRNREKELRDLIHSTKAEREQRAGRKIMDANFPANGTEFDKEDRATFASLLPGGLENLKDNAKEALKEAMENWMDMLPDVKEHMEYIRQKQNGKGQGEVSVIYRENDSQGAQWETVRVSSNDAWYSAAFKEKGSMPGQRDIIDYDHEQYLKELEARVKPGDAEGEMLIQNLKDAKKRVESLERVNNVISNLDKEDLTAQALLDPETYEKVYKPYLNQIQLAAKGTKAEAAARDSALILSKIAENMNKNYGIPLELAMAKIMKGQKISRDTLEAILKQTAALKELPKTGEEFTMPYYHINNQGRVKMPDDMMAQSIEPAGEYMGYDTSSKMLMMPNTTYGTITFKNPLVLEWKTSSHGGWKTELSAMFGGKTGKRLTNAIKKAGYDGIITVETNKGYILETVNIFGTKSKYNASLIPDPPKFFQIDHSNLDNELLKVKERYQNTDNWMKAPDGTKSKLTERQWLIAHSDSFKKWFENWETVEKYIQLVHESSLVLDRKEFQGGNRKEIGKSAKSVFKNSFPAKVNKSGRVEPSSITNRYGEQVYIPITGIKELIRHSADANTLQLIPNLKSIIKIATFLFEKEIDPSRKKKLNQSTKVYKYYGLKVKLEGKEYWARLIIREEKNGRKYFYDGDLKEIKKEPPQTVGPDPKNGGRSEKALFTHSIQEWLTNVKEVIDKIGDNGEILSEVIEQFNNESKYYQTMVPDKDLVVYHNVSERNLETAMELGALPMPSLAITRKDIDFGNFGEITLIGN